MQLSSKRISVGNKRVMKKILIAVSILFITGSGFAQMKNKHLPAPPVPPAPPTAPIAPVAFFAPLPPPPPPPPSDLPELPPPPPPPLAETY